MGSAQAFRDWLTMQFSGDKPLAMAAGIREVPFICDPATWRTVIRLANEAGVPIASDPGPGAVRDDGLAEITLTGESLSLVMHAMRTVWRAMFDPAAIVWHSRKFLPEDRAVAQRVYLALARCLQVGGASLAPITLDGPAHLGPTPPPA